MQTIRKINDELAIAGQIDSEQCVQVAQEGFRTILNLRSPTESGFLNDEQFAAEASGLHYVNLPLALEALTDETVRKLLQQLNYMPAPVLVHCDNAIRAAVIALMYISTGQGATLEQAFRQAKQLGLLNVCTQQ